ncbi:hypothetical protein JAAARDRAFT_195911 [Jaapia argillacea MUCL 33604]|uniref:CHAT domain-containing protein n=1 Tax=Jaapia argillacea MUCL 33604 TaxID=933084 RepID=A0A067PMJ0_9AGAM|nr:hypothetical protein JAAARDRAFT_195911 [Jaapia argillacea MUCL 33604]
MEKKSDPDSNPNTRVSDIVDTLVSDAFSKARTALHMFHPPNWDDLEAACALCDEAVRVSEGSEQSLEVGELSRDLFAIAQNYHNIDDITLIAGRQESFIAKASPTYPGLYLRLGFLGDLYARRAELRLLVAPDDEDLSFVSDIDDEREAAKYWKAALAVAPLDHPIRAGWLSRMGRMIIRGYYDPRLEVQRTLPRLEEAIAYQEEAVRLISRDDPDYDVISFGLAIAHGHRAAAQKLRVDPTSMDPRNLQPSYVGAAITYRRLVSPSVGHIRSSVSSGRDMGDMFFHTDPTIAIIGYARAVQLLVQLAWIGMDVHDRHEQLVEIASGTTSNAVACCIQNSWFERAIEFLDQGRSVLWQSALQIRAPLAEVEAVQPKLAEQMRSISEQLRSSASDDASRREQLAMDWERLMGQVKSLPGFEGFLDPPPYRTLARAASHGPIVIANISSFRCDALIIPSETAAIIHVPLCDVSLEHVQKLASKLKELLKLSGRTFRGSDRGMRVKQKSLVDEDTILSRILADLWDKIVSHILDALDLRKNLLNGPRRLFWCATGPLSSLPLHAAGKDGVNAMDFIASSYITTLSSQLRVSRQSFKPPHILLVALPHTPGASPLPCVQSELTAIQRVVEGYDGATVSILSDQDATVKTVEHTLGNAQWVHFMCHGVQDGLNSRFLLYDGPLPLQLVMQQTVRDAELAFLSACQTAAGDTQTPDEAIHLAGGLLLAGYSSVIATLWSIDDSDAPNVSEMFYEKLEEGHRLEVGKAAIALHASIQDLRARRLAPTRWVPFIHLGL